MKNDILEICDNVDFLSGKEEKTEIDIAQLDECLGKLNTDEDDNLVDIEIMLRDFDIAPIEEEKTEIDITQLDERLWGFEEETDCCINLFEDGSNNCDCIVISAKHNCLQLLKRIINFVRVK